METPNNRLVSWLLHLLLTQPHEPASPEAPVAPPANRFRRLLHSRYTAFGAAAVVVVVAVFWCLASLFLMHAQIGNSRLNLHADNQSLVNQTNKLLQNYKLAVQYPDHSTRKFRLATMGLRADALTSVTTVRAQESLRHRLEWWHPIPLKVTFTVDNAALNKFIDTNINQTVQPARDAALNIVNGQIQLTDASAGKQYGLTNPTATLLAAAGTLRSAPVVVRTLTINPALTAS